MEPERSVRIVNDGIFPCYVRATLTGNWVNADGDIIKPLNGEKNIVIRSEEWEQWWAFDPVNHIYYYKYPLQSGEETAVPLLDSLTVVGEVEGTTLELFVIVQASETNWNYD